MYGFLMTVLSIEVLGLKTLTFEFLFCDGELF